MSALTGLLTGLGAYQIADHIDVSKFLIFLAISTGKDALLFLKSHPAPEFDPQLKLPIEKVV